MSSFALDASNLAETLDSRARDGHSVREVFLVACGGSLVDLYSSRFLLATESRRLRADLCTANEFAHATPKALGEQSVAIVCSHGGGTRETVEAATSARSRGALTITLTHNPTSDIAELADRNIVYEWGDETNVGDNPMAISLALCLEILRHVDSYEHYDDFRRGLREIDTIVRTARKKVQERAARFADRYRDSDMFYVLSSGASFGHAYGFSICSLMEMQRLNASAIHSGEFFHGPLEITDETRNFIVLVNEGRTRPLDERLLEFLARYAERCEVIDARELGIDALPASVVDYFNPVLFYSVLCEYRAALARVRNHPLDTRRYMGKVEY